MATVRLNKKLFGRGFYSPAEAARLLRIPARRVRRWAAGYDFKQGQGIRFSEPVIKRELADDEVYFELTFLDLIELLFIERFLSEGVSLQMIRLASKKAADLYDTTHPFCDKKFQTDGFTIFARMRDTHRSKNESLTDTDERLIDLKNGQQVFNLIVSPYLRQFVYDPRTDLVGQWWPLGQDRSVVVNPNLSFGTPVIRDYGVPTKVLARAAKHGQNLDAIADWYQIPVEAVSDAVRFEHDLSAREIRPRQQSAS